MKINENDYLGKEYDSTIHYNIDSFKADTELLIENHLSKYWLSLNEDEVQRYTITKQKIEVEFEIFKKELIKETYDIYNYCHFLIGVFSEDINEFESKPIKAYFERVGILVLSLRLCRLSDRETIRHLDNEKKKRGKNYVFKTPKEYNIAILTAYDIFRENNNYRKIDKAHRVIIQLKEIEDFYNAEVFSKQLYEMKDLFLATNAPYEFQYLSDYCTEHNLLQELTQQIFNK